MLLERGASLFFNRRKDGHDGREETKWRAQVLRRTARICNAKAKMYERMLQDDAQKSAFDADSLRMVLKRIDDAAGLDNLTDDRVRQVNGLLIIQHLFIPLS